MRDDCKQFVLDFRLADVQRDLKRLQEEIAEQDLRSKRVSQLSRSPTETDVSALKSSLARDLMTYGVIALEWSDGAILDWLVQAASKHTAGIAPEFKRSQETLSAAIAIARCYAGVPCGNGSRYAAVICAGMGLCGDGADMAILASIRDPQARAAADAQARQLALALTGRDLALLGL